jgi:hypothetical protein
LGEQEPVALRRLSDPFSVQSLQYLGLPLDTPRILPQLDPEARLRY